MQVDAAVPQVECASWNRVLRTLTDSFVCRGLWRRPWYHQDAAALNGAPALMTGRQVVMSNGFFFLVIMFYLYATDSITGRLLETGTTKRHV